MDLVHRIIIVIVRDTREHVLLGQDKFFNTVSNHCVNDPSTTNLHKGHE